MDSGHWLMLILIFVLAGGIGYTFVTGKESNTYQSGSSPIVYEARHYSVIDIGGGGCSPYIKKDKPDMIAPKAEKVEIKK